MTIEVFPAMQEHLKYIDSLQRKNAEELAFYPKQVFEREINNFRILLAKVNAEPAGYIYHGSFGNNLKIHQACIQYDLRGQLYGSELVQYLIKLAKKMNSNSISLRCGSDIAANGFWQNMGFSCERVTQGGVRRRRDINHWIYQLQPTLFQMETTEPSQKKKDAKLWAKARRKGYSTNSFLRGQALTDYRRKIEKELDETNT